MRNFFPITQSQNIHIRPRINKILEELSENNIVSLVAGAGYGKTQSLFSYASALDATVLWFSFTTLDNHPSHFWVTVCSTIKALNPPLAQKLQQMKFPNVLSARHRAIRLLMDEIDHERPYILVLDDFHMIKDNQISETIQSLLISHFDNISIFLLSRNNNVFFDSKILKGPGIARLTEKELSFTQNEIGEYFNELKIPASQLLIQKVYQQTEGWPVAVYLTALALKDNMNINKMSFNLLGNSFIFDIIEREIFSTYNHEEQKFLLKLSLLDIIPYGYLHENFNKKFEHVIASNMFIKYNEYNLSYNFHQLFRDFLAQKMQILPLDELKDMYMQSAEWFLQNHMDIDALYCYRKLKNYDKMWQILQYTISNTNGYSKKSADLYLQIYKEFPKDYIKYNPEIKFSLATLYVHTGDFKTAIAICNKILTTFDSGDMDLKWNSTLGECLILKGLLYMAKGDCRFGKEFKKAVAYLPSGSQFYAKSRYILFNGDPITLASGKKNEMAEWIDTLKEHADIMDILTNGSTFGFEIVAEAQALYYQGYILEAEKHAQIGLAKAKQKKCVDIVCFAYNILCHIAMYKGNFEKALHYISLSKEYSQKNNWNPDFNMPEITEGFFYSRIGSPKKIPEWILEDTFYSKALTSCNYGLERIVKSFYLLFSKEYFELSVYLEQSEDRFLQTYRYCALLYNYILKAINFSILGEDNKMVICIKKAYDMAYENNIIMPFIEYGSYMKKVLLKLISLNYKEIPAEWIDLIQIRSSTYSKRISSIQNQLPGNKMKDLFSDREIELLRNLSNGLTREEIADSMGISVNTVKSFIKKVYNKLGAVNGSHAISIAIKNNIL